MTLIIGMSFALAIFGASPQDLSKADQAAQENRFEDAIAALKAAEKEALKAGSEAMLSQIRERALLWLEWKKQYEKAKPSFEGLSKAPDDPLHNLIAGRFTVFVKGDWATGIPMFLKCSD